MPVPKSLGLNKTPRIFRKDSQWFLKFGKRELAGFTHSHCFRMLQAEYSKLQFTRIVRRQYAR